MDDKSSHEVNLTDVSERDKPWDTHRNNALAVQTLYERLDYERYADRMSRCSLLLGFKPEPLPDSDEHRLALALASFCRVRFCPVCQWRRRLMWTARILKALPGLLEQYPKHRYLLLTLTVKNCPIESLRPTVRHMNKAWERLSKRKAFPAVGWLKSVEVTRNGSTGEAHPHIHAVLMVPPSYFRGQSYIKQADWCDLWMRSLKVDYVPSVNVKAIKGKNGDTQDIRGGLMEALKYQVKEDDLVEDADWLKGITQQLHKTRAVSVGGVFREFINSDEPEDLISEDEDKLTSDMAEVFFGWREVTRRYVKVDPHIGNS